MNKDINKLFGRRVSELRQSKHFSQEELADRCGVHRTYMGSIERGEKSPTLNTIKKIIDGLDISLKEFFDYETLYSKDND